MTTLRFGRYETFRQIAAGGMATVFLGRVLGAGGFQRIVAIKVMHPHIASDPDFVAMFLDEARLAASIHHPNVVATLDIEQGPQGLFIVMDYVDGPSLLHVIKEARRRETKIPLPITLRIFLDMLAGLHAAHELRGPDRQLLNLVHRDVSPQNVLAGRDGTARITDFGVARAEARISSTRGGELKGKLPYMPPEQIKAESVDRRCDVYAAGCVLWEMMVGNRLFRAENDAALVAQIVSGPRWSPSDVDTSLPVALSDVCMRALTEAKDCYSSASTFAMALEDAAMRIGVPIASPRAVGEYVTALFPPSMEALPPPSAAFDSQITSPPGRDADARTGGTNANLTASQITPAAAAARRGLALPIAVAATASLITGLGVWIATRTGNPAAASAGPTSTALVLTATAIAAPPPVEAPAPPPVVASAAPVASAVVSAAAVAPPPVDAGTKGSKTSSSTSTRATSTSKAKGLFRPEDP